MSSQEQEKEGYSIPAQLTLLNDYAHAKSLRVVHELVDVETAKTTGRQQFREMVKFLEGNPHTDVALTTNISVRDTRFDTSDLTLLS